MSKSHFVYIHSSHMHMHTLIEQHAQLHIYYRQAWTYSQRIELASRGTGHTLDLYNSKLQDLRRKSVAYTVYTCLLLDTSQVLFMSLVNY